MGEEKEEILVKNDHFGWQQLSKEKWFTASLPTTLTFIKTASHSHRWERLSYIYAYSNLSVVFIPMLKNGSQMVLRFPVYTLRSSCFSCTRCLRLSVYPKRTQFPWWKNGDCCGIEEHHCGSKWPLSSSFTSIWLMLSFITVTAESRWGWDI